MSISTVLIIALPICFIAGGILFLRKTANKFNLTPEQLAKIKKRNEALDKEEQEEEKSD